jgi:hypothetical protein
VERVEKNIPYEIRNQPPFNKIPDLSPSRAYNSWGVYHEHGASYRPYENEPLHIARRVLEDEGVPMIPILKAHGPQNQAIVRFAPWHITAQDSVRGVGSAGLAGRLKLHVTQENMDSWDSYGLKAISHVLTTSNYRDNLEELTQFTTGL